jgi:hypothetical protein
LSASVPVGLRRRNAGRSQHYSRREDSGDLASHFVLHSIAKLADPLSGRTNQSNCLRFIISNVRMDTFDYSGNPERPFQVRRTIQAEGNKHRWINSFCRRKPTETHPDPAHGLRCVFGKGATAISGRTLPPDEARRIAANIAKPAGLRRKPRDHGDRDHTVDANGVSAKNRG